jgi:hypothetical protein
MKASGTDSKNISVENSTPSFLLPRVATTLNKEGVKVPTSLTKGCCRTSAISSEEKVGALPVRVRKVFTCFAITICPGFRKLSLPVNMGMISEANWTAASTIVIPKRLASTKPANCPL